MDSLHSLLTRTLAGDLEAFGQVVARFQNMAFGYAYSMLGDPDDAEDAVQEALIIAHGKLADLRDRERFPGWFRRIVLSTCRSVAGKRASTVPLADAEARDSLAGDPAAAAERAELQRRVVSAIRCLSPPHRVATVLFYIDGYSIKEIAEFLQAPVGTVKRRLHDARKQLKERMIEMVGESVRGQQLPPEFRQEVLRRIGHWERFRGADEGKVEMVEADPEWVQLVEFVVELEPLSPECDDIRRCIARMEPCHEHYLDNTEAVVRMIGTMTPGGVFDCGEAGETRRKEAQAYVRALETWLGLDRAVADEHTREVFRLLGERTEAKASLASHLLCKLRDNGYSVYADEDEDFDRTESRIQHLEICNYNWRENIRIVLQEISAGKRLFDWHVPQGYNAHGDFPNRVPQLREAMAAVSAWAEGRAEEAGRWGAALGEATPEKRWLAASLCKHVRAQHSRIEGQLLLSMPSLHGTV